MRTLALGSVLAMMMFALAAACFGGGEACAHEGEEIVTDIPWSDSERAEYVLLDHETLEECGTGTLTVERQGDRYQLTLSFVDVDNENSDVSTVIVDEETLQPFSVRRERVIDGETEAVEGEYDREEQVIRVVEYTGDDDPRQVPRRLDEEHFYDNESSLFIWRTILFVEGYDVKYTTVLVNQGGSAREIRLRVREKEEITVPAGTFLAWRVDITGDDLEQVAFFADTPEHQLLFYDNSLAIFQLTSFEP